MMKKLIFLYLLPFYSFAQFTYVPDDNFEQELINLGVDWVFDDYVETSGIDTITYLYMWLGPRRTITGRSVRAPACPTYSTKCSYA